MKAEIVDFYILHQRKYQESSLLVSIFTSDHGKLSAILRVNKKQANLYQPLVKLRGDLSLAKKDGLSRVSNVEFGESFYKKSYINLLSLQYINELIYLLLSYSHEEIALFRKYDFILQNIDDENYKYLLRMFELELLESMGHGIYVSQDTLEQDIVLEGDYHIVAGGFKLSASQMVSTIKGKYLLKINQPISSWGNDDLKVISRVVRVNVDYLLAGKELKSRKLLVDYLNLKS
ncbi:MAG: DNA repair protein RecO (recombination protein O) [Francisella sp.]|jgi:DNA repair protein RecO (recombination protein O)